ncbi:MAG TPA: DUF4342 domain-containing protein [Microcoleaceae cyanobacterium]|jgi:hypothetical protein
MEPNPANTVVEEFKLNADDLASKLDAIIKQGEIRRVAVKNAAGDYLLDIPLNAGMMAGLSAAVLLPAMGALGAIGELFNQNQRKTPWRKVNDQDIWSAGLSGAAIAAAIMSAIAGIGIIGALAADLTIVVERTELG